MSPKRYYVKNATAKAIICSFMVCLSIVACGSVLSYPSPAVPDINSNPNPFGVNSVEESWIGGLVPLGAVLGGLVGGPLMDYLGRKLTLMICAVPFAVGWVIVIAAPNVGVMYAGRLIGGVSLGVASGVAHVYIAEISPPELRGSLCSLGETFFSIGMFYVYLFGVFLHWQWLGVACLAVVVVFVVLMLFLPETPRWLLVGCRDDDAVNVQTAREVLQWLRGPMADVTDELAAIQNNVLESRKVARWRDFLHREHLKNLAICLTLFTSQQMCGNAVVKMYTVSIFQATGSEMDPYVQTVLVGVVAFFGCLTCVLLVDKVGRRPLLIWSCALVAISMITLGAYFKVADYDSNYADAHLSWMPLFSLMLNAYSYGTGIGTITWVLPTELFPTEFRGKSNAVCVCWAELFSFVSSKFFVNVADAIGFAGGYWVCAGFGALGCVFSIVAAPETMKKSLEQLQLEIALKKVPAHEQNSSRAQSLSEEKTSDLI